MTLLVLMRQDVQQGVQTIPAIINEYRISTTAS